MKVENDQILHYFQTYLLNANPDLNNHFKTIPSNNFIEELVSLLKTGLEHRKTNYQLTVIPEKAEIKQIGTHLSIREQQPSNQLLSPHRIFGKPRVRLENDAVASPYSNYLLTNTKISYPLQKLDGNSQTSIAVDFNQRHNFNPSIFASGNAGISGNSKVVHHFSIKKEVQITIYPFIQKLQDNLSRFESYLFKDIPQTQKSVISNVQPIMSTTKDIENKKSKFGQPTISQKIISPQQQLQKKELKLLRKQKKKLQKMLLQEEKQLEKAHHRASQEIRRLKKQESLCSCCSEDEEIVEKLQKMYIQLHNPLKLKTYKITSNPQYTLSSSQSSVF